MDTRKRNAHDLETDKNYKRQKKSFGDVSLCALNGEIDTVFALSFININAVLSDCFNKDSDDQSVSVVRQKLQSFSETAFVGEVETSRLLDTYEESIKKLLSTCPDTTMYTLFALAVHMAQKEPGLQKSRCIIELIRGACELPLDDLGKYASEALLRFTAFDQTGRMPDGYTVVRSALASVTSIRTAVLKQLVGMQEELCHSVAMTKAQFSCGQLEEDLASGSIDVDNVDKHLKLTIIYPISIYSHYDVQAHRMVRTHVLTSALRAAASSDPDCVLAPGVYCFVASELFRSQLSDDDILQLYTVATQSAGGGGGVQPDLKAMRYIIRVVGPLTDGTSKLHQGSIGFAFHLIRAAVGSNSKGFQESMHKIKEAEMLTSCCIYLMNALPDLHGAIVRTFVKCVACLSSGELAGTGKDAAKRLLFTLNACMIGVGTIIQTAYPARQLQILIRCMLLNRYLSDHSIDSIPTKQKTAPINTEFDTFIYCPIFSKVLAACPLLRAKLTPTKLLGTTGDEEPVYGEMLQIIGTVIYDTARSCEQLEYRQAAQSQIRQCMGCANYRPTPASPHTTPNPCPPSLYAHVILPLLPHALFAMCRKLKMVPMPNVSMGLLEDDHPDRHKTLLRKCIKVCDPFTSFEKYKATIEIFNTYLPRDDIPETTPMAWSRKIVYYLLKTVGFDPEALLNLLHMRGMKGDLHLMDVNNISEQDKFRVLNEICIAGQMRFGSPRTGNPSRPLSAPATPA